MEILSSRVLLRPADLDRSRRFYRDVLGLAVYREFGPVDDPGVVVFRRTVGLEVRKFAAVRSGLPSPFTSLMTIESGPLWPIAICC